MGAPPLIGEDIEFTRRSHAALRLQCDAALYCTRKNARDVTTNANFTKCSNFLQVQLTKLSQVLVTS